MKKFLIYAAIIIALPILVILPGDWYFMAKSFHYDHSNKNILIISHRGASGLAPENTLVAIQKAIDLEADVIEIDVYPSKDSIPVVIHDADLKRTTNGDGRITELTAAEIAHLDAGSWFDKKFKGESVPTLEDVIELIDGQTKLLIEIKETGSNIERRVVQLINQYKAKGWCIIQSFSPEVIQKVQLVDASIEVQQLAIGNVTIFPLHWNNGLRLGTVYQYESVKNINLNYLFVTQKVIDRIHGLGKKIYVWTVNNPEDMRKLADMGVDGIITDFPDKAKALLKPVTHKQNNSNVKIIRQNNGESNQKGNIQNKKK